MGMSVCRRINQRVRQVKRTWPAGPSDAALKLLRTAVVPYGQW